MKKNLTKKLMLSVLTLAFAVVSLGASTFAWFTVGGKQQSASFEATVVNGVGLDIAFTETGENPTEWHSAGSLATNALNDLIKKLNGTGTELLWNLNAVTPKATPAVGEKLAFGDIKGTAASKSYIEFDIWFKLADTSNPTPFTVYMEKFDIKASTPVAWTCDNEFTVKSSATETMTLALNKSNDYSLLSALRVSFNSSVAAQEIEGVWEQDDNFNVDKTTGVVLAGYNTKGAAKDKTTGAYQYYIQKTNWNEEGVFAPVVQADQTFKYENYKLSFNDAQQIGTIKTTEQFKVTVRLWVEGWDAECLNGIFAQKISVDMQLALRDEAGNELA